MNKKLEEILELCLTDIKEGRATLEECLLHHPKQARDLEPLLRVSLSLRKMPLLQPSEKRVLASRQRILQEFRAPAPVSWWRRTFVAPALAFSAVFTFILLAVFGTGVFLAASNGRLLASAYPNPSPAYPQTSPTTQPKIAFNSISLPGKVAGPHEIVSAPDGTLWFIQADTAQVGSVDAKDGKTRNWPAISNTGRAAGITVDSAGKVWFTISSSQSVITLDPKSNIISSWHVPAGAGSLGRIAAGIDGRIWFIAADGSRIYSLEVNTDEFTAYEVDAAEYLLWADNALWFSGKAGQLGQITPDGQVVLFDVPGDPAALVWDGNSLWYAGGALIGQFDTASGKINTYPLVSQTADRIATDGLGNIWFGSQGGSELGVLQIQDDLISMRSLDSMVQNLYSLAVGTDKVWMSDSESSFIYAFSLAKPGDVNLPNPVSLHVDRFMVSLSFSSLPQGQRDGVAGIP